MLAARVLRRRRRNGAIRRVVVTGTFYHANWYLSHARPLATSGVDEVIVVADAPPPELEGVRVICPPRWARRLLGRAGAKLATLIRIGLRARPDAYMGFHLFPGAISALLVARLFGKPACYQMTGGPIEIIGGGVHGENRLIRRLQRPSAILERLATALARDFELVVVRGERAAAFLRQQGLNGTIAKIPASVDCERRASVAESPRFDLVFVGRLTEIKQPELFVEVVAAVARRMPGVRAVMVGDGPLKAAAAARAAARGLNGQLTLTGSCQDVAAVLAASRVFVMTSRSEGLSIAMLEAMAAGLPVVAPDVGELAEALGDGEAGYVVRSGTVSEYVAKVCAILGDERLQQRMSARAAERAREFAACENVARRWREAWELLASSE